MFLIFHFYLISPRHEIQSLQQEISDLPQVSMHSGRSGQSLGDFLCFLSVALQEQAVFSGHNVSVRTVYSAPEEQLSPVPAGAHCSCGSPFRSGQKVSASSSAVAEDEKRGCHLPTCHYAHHPLSKSHV